MYYIAVMQMDGTQHMVVRVVGLFPVCCIVLEYEKSLKTLRNAYFPLLRGVSRTGK